MISQKDGIKNGIMRTEQLKTNEEVEINEGKMWDAAELVGTPLNWN